MSFDLDQLIADCAAATDDHAPTKAVREIVAHAVEDANRLLA